MLAAMGNNLPLHEILNELIRLAEVGNVPANETLGHQDGWGIVVVPDFKWENLQWIRSNRSIIGDPLFKNLDLWNTPNFKGQIFCHLRKASKGENTLENTHPFKFPRFYFMHNGTIHFSQETFHKFKLIHPSFTPLHDQQLNGTDTVIYGELFNFFIEKTNNIETAWKETISWINASQIEYTSTSSAMISPNIMGFIRNFSKDEDYYQLHYAHTSDYVIISQEKTFDLTWKSVLPKSGVLFERLNEKAPISSSPTYLLKQEEFFL